MSAKSHRVDFPGHSGARLSARLDAPVDEPRAYAIFAHCFTCSKDLMAVRRISAELVKSGIAVLRFDFTGLGSSEGEFASTNFTSNVGDLVSAADYLREHHRPASLLIGHSLGGAAVLAAAGDIADAKAVVTIGAPADPAHVVHNFGTDLETIEREGEAEVALAGRTFTIRKQFLDDVSQTRLTQCIAGLKRPLLILHGPLDQTVGIDNASAIFTAARHPKSFVSLDTADHLVSRPEDATFAARVIAGWVERYLPADEPQGEAAIEHVRVSETGEGKFQNAVQAGRHRLFADEPESVGGLDSGPSPYDLLSAGLAACTSMTIRMYANFKKIDLGRISVDVAHNKIHASDCADCTDDQKSRGGKIDRFTRTIRIEGEVPDEIRTKIVEIAGKCPVHRTLEASSSVHTELDES